MLSKTINIPIYDIDLVIKVVKELDCKAIVYIKGSAVYAVFEKGNITDLTLVHESIHIVNRIFRICGVELCLENDEHQAYLTEHIFKELKKICL